MFSFKGVDIIVFPEIGLTSLPIDRNWTIDNIRTFYYSIASFVPEPKENAILCDADNRYTKVIFSSTYLYLNQLFKEWV